MTKKELQRLTETIVLSTQATLNQDVIDGEPPMTEDEARTLVAMKIRKTTRAFVAGLAECEKEDVVLVEAEKKTRKKTDEDADGTEEAVSTEPETVSES